MDKAITALLLLLLTVVHGYGQRFGGNPPSVKWRQIDSDTARIIFPQGLERQAATVANLIHRLDRISAPTIGNMHRKINVVLQNRTVNSNGYVALGPYRSEFFVTPRQNSFELGSLPWESTLALHEFRHVQQFNNFRQGVSKWIYYAFGEEGLALANSAAVPDWFFEGDAVFQETWFSSQGRGDLPYFLNSFKSIWSAGKDYSWMKLRNGSYRDLVPDHYPLGYMLVSYGRKKYGVDFWKKVTADAVKFNKVFYPFQHAIKKYSGVDFARFRSDALNYFKDSLASSTDSAARYAGKFRHLVAHELFPQWTDSNHIIYLKSDYDHIPAFVFRDIHSGRETKIRVKDISTDNYFSLKNNFIVYSGYEINPRWGWEDYAVIKLLNHKTGTRKTITHRTKYFSPDISEDGKTIIAVHWDPRGASGLHLISTSSGKIIRQIPNSEELIYTYPKFMGNDSIVTAVRNKNGEMALMSVHLPSGQHHQLTPFTMNVMGFLNVSQDTVNFSMTEKGRDKLFMYVGGKTYELSPPWQDGSAGYYQLASKNGKQVWTTYTAAGYHIVTGLLKPILFRPESRKKIEGDDLLANLKLRNYDVKKYPSTYGLFNFHSWRPFISDPEYAYSITGENILNTFRSELYFIYNSNELYKETGASFSYAGLFPVISASGSFTFDRRFVNTTETRTWNEFNASIGMSVPLSFIHGINTTRVQPSAALVNKQLFYTGASKNQFGNRQFNSSDISLSVTNQENRAIKNIFPRFAQSLYLRHRAVLNKFTARQWGVDGSFFFPGLFTNHSLVVQGAYQSRDTGQQYNFTNTFSFARGYSDVNYPRMWKAGVNYHFPIAYPDWGFGNILYLLRVRGNAFFDFSRIKSLRTGERFDFRSLGLEVYLDSRWWNQLPLSFGLRYSRVLDGKILGLRPNQWEFILPLNVLER